MNRLKICVPAVCLLASMILLSGCVSYRSGHIPDSEYESANTVIDNHGKQLKTSEKRKILVVVQKKNYQNEAHKSHFADDVAALDDNVLSDVRRAYEGTNLFSGVDVAYLFADRETDSQDSNRYDPQKLLRV